MKPASSAVPPDALTPLAISGVTGRMGRVLVDRVAARSDFRIAGGIARRSLAGEAAQAHGCPRIERPASADALLEEAGALIDFSAPDSLRELLERHAAALAGKPVVIGTTGLDDSAEALLDRAAAHSAVLVAANFSPGINVLLGAVETAARALPGADYDLEIIEMHHRRKADAPSGTALAIASAAAAARGQTLEEVRRDGRSGRTGERPIGEVGLHAVRGGGVIGEHAVLLLGERERVEFRHQAADRSVFADGALLATRWLIGKAPGRYTMRQVLGL